MESEKRSKTSGFFSGLFGMSLLRGVIPTIASVIFVVYVSYLGWMSLGPQKPTVSPERKSVADTAITKIVDQLSKGRGEMRQTVLVHFANDPSDYFTDQLRAQLDSTAILNLEDRGFWEKLRNKLNLRNQGCKSLAEALEEVDGSSSQCVLWGALTHFESSSAGVIIKGQCQLAEIKSGKVICTVEINEDTTSAARANVHKQMNEWKEAFNQNTSFFAQTAQMMPWYIRFLGFVLLVLLLPIVTISFIRTMVAKRSNRVNAYMLGIYSLIDAIFAFFMVGGAFNSGWTVFLFLIAAGIAVAYNYALMNFALKLES